MASDTPRYQHSCPWCRFLGRSTDGVADLYVCNLLEHYGPFSYLLARFADERHHTGRGYVCWTAKQGESPTEIWGREAYRLAFPEPVQDHPL